MLYYLLAVYYIWAFVEYNSAQKATNEDGALSAPFDVAERVGAGITTPLACAKPPASIWANLGSEFEMLHL